MAAAVCAVVNGGKLMQPYIVSDILAPDGSVIEHIDPVCKRQVLKVETSRTMREMMESVVLRGGGRNAQIPGYRVGGKSGTSQKLDSADEKARIASFVAVAPIDDPQFLCLVCLDEPHSWTTAGGSLSAPVCAEVLEQTLVYKGHPPHRRERSPPCRDRRRPPCRRRQPKRGIKKKEPERSSKKARTETIFFSVLVGLLAELDLTGGAVHGVHDGKALQLDALAADQLAALLEALFPRQCRCPPP